MKKKNVIIISIIIVVLAATCFIGYKYYLLNKYSTSQFDNEYSYFLDILKKKDTYTIEHKENPAYNYLTYDKLKLENVFTNYVLKDQDQNNLVEYQLYENDKVISSVMFLETNPIYKSEIFKDEEKIPIDNILKRHNLQDTLELFEYLTDNENKNCTIFSSKEDIKENYAIKKALTMAYGDTEDTNNNLQSITFIDGQYKGYLMTYPTSYEINILWDEKVYSIFLIKTNLSKEQVYDLLDTLKIESK